MSQNETASEDELAGPPIAVMAASGGALIFLAGLLVGAANLPPTGLIKDAWGAAKAVMHVRNESAYPATFIETRPDLEPGPHLREHAGLKGEDGQWIMVTGGPFELLDTCPTYGCLAWVMDRDGAVVHAWEADLGAVWENRDHVNGDRSPDAFDVVGLHLAKDGGVIAAFHNSRAYPTGAGHAKFDVHGELVWMQEGYGHHWFTVDEDENVYAPVNRIVDSPLRLGDTAMEVQCPEGKVQLDDVRIIDADGGVVRDIDLVDLLVKNGLERHIDESMDPCDPLHLNFVEYVTAAMAHGVDLLEEGDLLVSMRSTSSLILFDPDEMRVKWTAIHRTNRQHAPRFVAPGEIVVFDNYGGVDENGGLQSEIVRIDLEKNLQKTIFPDGPLPDDASPFFTIHAGHISVHPDADKLLVSVNDTGVIWEIDLATHDTLWRYEKVFSPEGYPTSRGELDSPVMTEALGAYYVDAAVYGPIFEAARAQAKLAPVNGAPGAGGR